jgi:hypothetical protein
MFSIRSLIEENNKTFYDYGSNRPTRIRGRIVATSVASAVAATCIDHDFKDFLNGVITVQAILIGFSFSVMFFLMSSTSAPETDQDTEESHDNFSSSRESKIRKKRLSKLSKEIFYNVGYFNMSAMACLALALVILLPDHSDTIWKLVSFPANNFKELILKIYTPIIYALSIIVRFSFFFLLLESGFTFSRTVGRVNYLFEQKLPPEINNNPAP